jgi:lysyl-tRNA synthetase class 2
MFWWPTADFEALRRRAAILARIRAFFAARGVLEVETPALSAATVTDLHLRSIACTVEVGGQPTRLFLQTSPEFAMKRLLAAGSGPIYQIAKAFRDGERGRLHNPEFTMLEWYRPGFDHHTLMDEMDELLQEILGGAPAERLTYGAAFAAVLGFEPDAASVEQLSAAACAHRLEVVGMDDAGRDDWLHLLMSHLVEPTLGHAAPVFLYDYPASMAALARLRPAEAERGLPAVAERFEVYVRGVELANGFHELADGEEQRRRFEADLAERERRGLPAVPVDEHLLQALHAGLPDCAGVALGIDRLVLAALGGETLPEVLTFPIERA